jgi:hypothetical protein
LKKFQILQKNLQKPLLFLFLLLPKPLPVTWLSSSVVQSTCGDVHTMSKNLATASLQKATEFVHIFIISFYYKTKKKKSWLSGVNCILQVRNWKPLSETSANYKH